MEGGQQLDMSTRDGLLGRLRQPEYTGENRCLPCTVVNTVIAFVAATGVGLGGWFVAGPPIGAVVGIGVLAVGLASIALRGYLVPGTPELTKRYFPPWLLALFGKEEPGRHQPLAEDGALDPETALLRVGALEECADGEDLCLTDSYRTAWERELERIDPDGGREQLPEMLDTESDDLSYEEFGAAFRARIDGQVVGKWESEPAFLADLAAARVFERQFSGWDDLPVRARGQLLNGLRLFIETCPRCGGRPTFGSDTVESCCERYDVAAVACEDCEARLFETPVG